MEFKLEQIAQMVGGTIKGNHEIKINKLAKIEEASEGSIAFLSNPKYENYIYTTSASAVIVNKNFEPRNEVQTTLIMVDDPYTSFSTLLEEYIKLSSLNKTSVEAPCFLGENSSIGEDVYRGAFSYVGANCKIGNGVKIYPQVYIGDDVIIGDHTVLYPGVKIYSKSIIGKRCVLHSGVVIGSDGFGYAPQSDGSYKAIPQTGNVVIEDNVDLGANTVIDCAVMESTILRKGVKLDNLVQVGHNVEIGQNTVIAAQCGIAGSTKIGNNCVIAGQVGIVGHIKIADKMTIAAQSGVTKSFLEEGSVILGSPAFDRKEYLRSYAVFKNLPDLKERVLKLEVSNMS